MNEEIEAIQKQLEEINERETKAFQAIQDELRKITLMLEHVIEQVES